MLSSRMMSMRRLASVALRQRSSAHVVRYINSGPMVEGEIVAPNAKADLEQAVKRHAELRALSTEPSLELRHSLEQLGKYYYESENWQDTVEIEQQLYNDYYTSLIDKARSNNRFGILYQHMGHFDDSRRHFKESLSLYQQLHPDMFHSQVGEAWNSLAGLSATESELHDALELLERAEPHFRHHDKNMYDIGDEAPPPHPELRKVLENKGQIFRLLGEHMRALGVYQDIEDVLMGGKADRSLQLDLADCMLTLGQNEEARDLYLKALKTLEPDSLIAAAVYHQLGLFYATKEQSEEALDYFHKALDSKVRHYGDTHLDVAKTHNAMGAVYAALSQTRQSLTSFRQAIVILRIHTEFKKEEDDPEIQHILKNITLVQKDMGSSTFSEN